MSLAEQLRQEGHMAGRQEGRREGHLEGRQEAILSNLEIRFGQVPQGLEEAMRQVVDPKHLESLQRASFTCASIEEIAAAL
jgi:predicted transposase YdaD